MENMAEFLNLLEKEQHNVSFNTKVISMHNPCLVIYQAHVKTKSPTTVAGLFEKYDGFISK